MKPQTLSIVKISVQFHVWTLHVPYVNCTCHPYSHTGTPGESQVLDPGTQKDMLDPSSPEIASPSSLQGISVALKANSLGLDAQWLLWKSFCSGMASCMSLSADGEKDHSKVVLQGFFESSARTEGKLFRKKKLYCWKAWLYLSQNIYDPCMSIWDTKQLICKQQKLGYYRTSANIYNINLTREITISLAALSFHFYSKGKFPETAALFPCFTSLRFKKGLCISGKESFLPETSYISSLGFSSLNCFQSEQRFLCCLSFCVCLQSYN